MAKFIDNGIEKFASYLRDRNNLDHITYLKVRLGMQTFVINLTKIIVTYGVSLLLGLFFYTLTVHIPFLLMRLFAHGAHAKNSFICHVLNIFLFIFLPWLVLMDNLHFLMLFFGIIGFALLIKFAPGITKKQPIPKRFHKSKKIKSLCVASIIFIIALIIKSPFNNLMLYSIFIVGLLQLPIFLHKEEKTNDVY